MHLRIVVVKGLLYKLASNEFVDNFHSTKLDVSLLTKMTNTLSWVLIVLNDASIADDVKDVLGNAIFEVHKLFDEIKTESLRCKVDAEFRRVINSKFQKLIEKLEGLKSGEQVGELGVFETNWSQTSISYHPLSTSVKLLLDKIVSSNFIGKFQATKLDVSLLEKLKTILVRVLDTDYVKVTPSNPHDLHDAVDILTFRLWVCMLGYTVFKLNLLFDKILYLPLFKQSIRVNDINSELQNLIARLEFTSLQPKGQFGGSSFKSDWHETPSSSILDDESSSIYGRDNDIKELKHLLLSEDGEESKIGIISIVGAAGIGKTTLAKLLYNDPEVYNKFELQVWAHVSKDFHDLNVFETILNDRKDTGEVNNIFPKCLLILDEVCDARSVRTLLMNISNLGKRGSRIIITTQDERVALSMQTFALYMQTFLFVHYMTPLESEDCWSILSGHAFAACNDQSYLEDIGREIAESCHGSPYVAVAVGDILRSKFSPDYWNYVLESDIMVLTDHDVKAFIQLMLCILFKFSEEVHHRKEIGSSVVDCRRLIRIVTDQEKVRE